MSKTPELNKLKRIGAGMANSLFNLAHNETLPADIRELLRDQQREWDAAMSALQSAADTPPPQSHLPSDVFSVHDGGNSITLHFAEIKSARAFRDTFPASIVAPAPEKQVNGSEPIAWIAKSRWDQMTAAEPWLTNIVYSEDQNPYFDCVPLYGEPRDRSAYEKGVRDGVEEALQIAADQARLMADLAIEGLPENARSREAMEAALTRFSDNLRVTLEGLSIPGRAALAASAPEDALSPFKAKEE